MEDRLAVVYVRQSTLQQLARHQEATRLQYGLVERAMELGWPRGRIEVIDEDLGKSGATAEGRAGFQRQVERGHPQSCWHRAGHRDVTPGPLLPGLVPVAGSVRAVRHLDRRSGRHLRSDRLQRPAAAGLEQSQFIIHLLLQNRSPHPRLARLSRGSAACSLGQTFLGRRDRDAVPACQIEHMIVPKGTTMGAAQPLPAQALGDGATVWVGASARRRSMTRASVRGAQAPTLSRGI